MTAAPALSALDAPTTHDAELAQLISEQAADDTHWVNTPRWQVSLDATAPSGEGGTIGEELLGRDPWSLVDACIDLGLDPAEVAYSGELVSHLRPRRGEGLADGQNIRHGTIYGYRRQECRCPKCRAAQAAHVAEYRARKRAEALA